MKLGEKEFVAEAMRIVEAAQSRGVYLRVLGALAVYIHSLDNSEIAGAFKSLGRFGEGQPVFTDLDLGAYLSCKETSLWASRLKGICSNGL